MRVLLFLVLCCFSLSSFAQSSNFPTVLGGKDNLPTYNLRPDLQILGVQLGSQINGRQSLLIKIRNNGSEYAVPSTFSAKFTWKATPTSKSQHFGFSQGVPGIKAKRTIVISTVGPPGLTLTNTIPLFLDPLTLQIIVDFSNQNDEYNEQNNRFIQAFGFSY